jgi:hypothetical protein
MMPSSNGGIWCACACVYILFFFQESTEVGCCSGGEERGEK